MIKCFAAGAAAVAGLFNAVPVLAQSAQTVTATAETDEYSDGYGSLRSLKLEYKVVDEGTTVLFTPAIGERRAGGLSDTAVGGGATIYHDWSSRFSTRASAFVAENAPVFANTDLALDATAKVGPETTVTVGGRYARYFGGKEVTFVSAGVRQYFRFGSVAYRLTRVDPEGRDPFLAHLFNVSLKDGQGNGKTQLWLSTGDASITRVQTPANFSGKDYAATLQRVQPISGKLNLVPQVGYSSYARPGNRVGAVSLGLGVAVGLD
jgi:YaiO family outer membrane protein